MSRGRFIVLEGGEGSGKSTQARLLARRLRAAGREVVETFAPGGTPRGERIRALVLDDHSSLDGRAELLLLAADRAQHVADVIEPALTRGADVVCDRFHPSTLAYQGVGRDLGVDTVEDLVGWAARGVELDVVIVLDVDESVAATRLGDDLDRLEQAGPEFHERVRTAYRDLAEARGWTVIDGGGDAETVADLVWQVVSEGSPPAPGSAS